MQAGLGILMLALLAAVIAGSVFAYLAAGKAIGRTRVAAGVLLPFVAILAVPPLLEFVTGGKAAWEETVLWVVPLALAVPFVWLSTLGRPPGQRATAPGDTRARRPAREPPPRKPQTQKPQASKTTASTSTPAGAPTIFISYRRDDSADVTGRLYDRLAAAFGRERVYKDVDTIPLGVDFRDHINKLVGSCDVVLTVIGRQWLTVAGSDDRRRLDDETDPVRLEIVAALKRGIPVVPVLVSGSNIPPAEALPDDIRNLAFRNGTRVRPDPDFHRDVDRLIAGLRSH